MEPTIDHGDIIFASSLTREYNTGDVVVLKNPLFQDRTITKRITVRYRYRYRYRFVYKYIYKYINIYINSYT